MNCPQCGALSTVVDSRQNKNGSVRRRRVCNRCRRKWTTLEFDAEAIAAVQRVARLFHPVEPTEHARPNNPTPPPKSRQYRSGYIVPPELEADWQTLKRHGYRDADAADALGGLKKEARE